MNDKRKNPWKACFGILLLVLMVAGYNFYPDYDTTDKRTALLSEKVGGSLEIVEEVEIGAYTVCQVRTDGLTGCAVFQEILGKCSFQWIHTTNSDRLFDTFETGSETWLILVCGQPDLGHAVVHYYDYTTGTYNLSDPIDMAGKQMLVISHQPGLGSYDHTVYYDTDGNPV